MSQSTFFSHVWTEHPVLWVPNFLTLIWNRMHQPLGLHAPCEILRYKTIGDSTFAHIFGGSFVRTTFPSKHIHLHTISPGKCYICAHQIFPGKWYVCTCNTVLTNQALISSPNMGKPTWFPNRSDTNQSQKQARSLEYRI